MTVRINEDTDDKGNVIARDIEISMPEGYRDIRTYNKENYELLKCNHCGKEVCMWDGHDIFGDYICIDCWDQKPNEWEEEH